MFFLVDKVVDKMIDEALNSMDKMLVEKKLKKILKKSIEDCLIMQEIRNPNYEPQCVVDENKIQKLEKKQIMPNLSVEKLESNLKDFFSECIVVDDENKAEKIRKIICCNYKEAVVDYITLNQVDEDIHELNKSITNKNAEISDKLDIANNKICEMSEEVKTINKRLRSNVQYPINFIDQLDDSKVFCYISIQVLDDIDDDFLNEIADYLCAEMNVYEDENGFNTIDFNFLEPTVQSEIKKYMKRINDKFCEESIRILSVSSHA